MGQVTPGPVTISATFIGYKAAGLPGALVATVAIFAPFLILVVLLEKFYLKVRVAHAWVVTRAFLLQWYRFG